MTSDPVPYIDVFAPAHNLESLLALEKHISRALTSEADYVAFVASKIKAEKVMDFLRAGGLPEKQLSRLRAPAGMNIDAKTPEDIAVSVLAEIIQVRGAKSSPASQVKAAELFFVIN